MTRAENGAALVRRHHAEYNSVYADATAAKGADAEHKPEAARKLAAELAAIEKADPSYYRTIISQLNGKFKAEDFGLPSGEQLLGGVTNGTNVDLVTRSSDGKKINYYGETSDGHSQSISRVGQLDNTPAGDQRHTEGSSITPPAKLNDGSGTYIEGKNDRNMWDVARHVLGYDKLDTLAKKNEAANLIKLLEKDPENAKKIKEGTIINIPALTLGELPGAPGQAHAPEASVQAPAPALPADKPPADAPLPTPSQVQDPTGDQTIEDLIKKKSTPGEKPVDKVAETLAATVRKDNADMIAASDAVFTKKMADILGVGDPSQIRFGSPNDVEDAIWAAKKYGKANPNDVDAQNLIKGLQYMKDNWSKYEVSGMASSPYLDAASFKRVMEKRNANLVQLEKQISP